METPSTHGQLLNHNLIAVPVNKSLDLVINLKYHSLYCKKVEKAIIHFRILTYNDIITYEKFVLSTDVPNGKLCNVSGL